MNNKPKSQGLRMRIHEVIFEADTPAGKGFDLLLLVLILLSVVVVMLESVGYINRDYARLFRIVELVITALFSVEYALRIYCVKKPWKYIFSFYGLVDLLSILPFYLSLVFTGTQVLATIRILRLMRVFRILKLGHYLSESEFLMRALYASRRKITVFLAWVLTLVVIIGTLMYVIEGGTGSKFSSIPQSMYWAIVTMTTVGYGDIAPSTPTGQFLASILMILGYGIIAVPTGIVTFEMASDRDRKIAPVSTQACQSCGREGHDTDAEYCKFCGHPL